MVNMAAYPGTLLESGSGSNSSGTNFGVDDDAGASLPRYRPLLADRLDRLDLPPSADGVDPDTADGPDLPSVEVIEALTRSSFLDDELRGAIVEYQVQKYLSGETAITSDRTLELAETHDVYSLDDDIPTEEFVKDSRQLKSRTTPVDEHDKLDQEETDEHELKRAFYRIRALLVSSPVTMLLSIIPPYQSSIIQINEQLCPLIYAPVNLYSC
jgi:hypothetical protein